MYDKLFVMCGKRMKITAIYYNFIGITVRTTCFLQSRCVIPRATFLQIHHLGQKLVRRLKMAKLVRN